jgi:hypothetical protein
VEAIAENGETMDVGAFAAAVARPSDGMQAQAVGVMRSSVGFLGLRKGYSEKFMARQGYSGNGGLGALGYGMVSPLGGGKTAAGSSVGILGE